MRTGSIVVFNGMDVPFTMQSHAVRPLKMKEVLVKTLYTTICGSDLHTFCGLRHEKTPTVLGHEIVGRIEEIDEHHSGRDNAGRRLMKGDIVTWSVFASDPASAWAKEGIPQKGTDLFKYGHAQVKDDDVFHGGLAEYCILKANTAILKVPSNIPLPIAATLNCAIATVAGALRLAGSIKGKTVLITGMGLLGIVCAAMCKDAGASWVGTADISASRLRSAMDFGCDASFLLADNTLSMVGQLRNMHSRGGIDIAFDMSGSPDAMEFGVETLAINGVAVWVGAVFNTRPIHINAEQVIRKLLSIKGLHNYNYTDFRYALDFLTRNIDNYPFRDIVEKEYPLAQAQEAFEYAVQYKPLRVGINMEHPENRTSK